MKYWRQDTIVFSNVTLVNLTCQKSWLAADCTRDIVQCTLKRPALFTYYTVQKISQSILRNSMSLQIMHKGKTCKSKITMYRSITRVFLINQGVMYRSITKVVPRCKTKLNNGWLTFIHVCKKLIQVIMYVYKHKTLSNICMKFYSPEVLMMNNVQQWMLCIKHCLIFV